MCVMLVVSSFLLMFQPCRKQNRQRPSRSEIFCSQLHILNVHRRLPLTTLVIFNILCGDVVFVFTAHRCLACSKLHLVETEIWHLSVCRCPWLTVTHDFLPSVTGHCHLSPLVWGTVCLSSSPPHPYCHSSDHIWRPVFFSLFCLRRDCCLFGHLVAHFHLSLLFIIIIII